MRLPVAKIMKDMKEVNQSKTKIGLGYIMTEKFEETKENTREGRSLMMRNEVVGCVHPVVAQKKILVHFPAPLDLAVDQNFCIVGRYP